MRYFILAFVLVIAIAIPNYFLLSLGDYRALLVLIPIALLLTRQISDRDPGMLAAGEPCALNFVIEPLDDCDEGYDDPPIEGFWIGTVQVWPTRLDEVVHVFRIRLAIKLKPSPACVLLSPEEGSPDGELVAARLLELDVQAGTLELELVIAGPAGAEQHIARLEQGPTGFVPQDESERVTVELAPARAVAIDGSRALSLPAASAA